MNIDTLNLLETKMHNGRIFKGLCMRSIDSCPKGLMYFRCAGITGIHDETNRE